MDPSAVAPRPDKAGVAQHGQVPGDRRLRGFERGVEVAHATLPAREHGENAEPDGLARRLEDGGQGMGVGGGRVHGHSLIRMSVM